METGDDGQPITLTVGGPMTNLAGGYGAESGPYVMLVSYRSQGETVSPYQVVYYRFYKPT